MLGTNPKQLAKIMKQMGIETEDLPAKRVVIECEGYNIVVNNPIVTKISMKGSTTFQVTGDTVEEETISDEDVKLVMEQSGASREEAVRALKETNGDIAEAILKLQGE
ncbi:nascent polypeptide-associated complex protein [Candidatus Micrarchaeota archaeon]|nr:nascent polypeptide-associated complex protein [Candidatus Micrarchaeota archaeon]